MDAFYAFLARLLSFDDVRRVLTSVFARTSVTEVVVETAEGRFLLDPRDRIVTWSIIGRGTWEPYESGVLAVLVRPGDTVLDIGAHVGWYTMLFANRVGENGRVIAFEPHPRNFELLTLNAELNAKSNVELHQVALVAERGTVSLIVEEQNFAGHHVRFGSEEPSARTIQVSGFPLDDIVIGDTAIRLIKMDCEGAEPAVLEGGRRTLERCEYLASEYVPAALVRAGFRPSSFLDFITARFRLFRRLREGTEFRPIGELAADAALIDSSDRRVEGVNYLLVR